MDFAPAVSVFVSAFALRMWWIVSISMVTTFGVGLLGWCYFFIIEHRLDHWAIDEDYWSSAFLARMATKIIAAVAQVFRQH